MMTWAFIYDHEKIADMLTDAQKDELQGEIDAALKTGHAWVTFGFGSSEYTYGEFLITPGIPMYFVPQREATVPRRVR